MRYFLSDVDKTHKMDASASTKHYIPSSTNQPESHMTHERGTKRKSWDSWGQLLSLKTGVALDENDAQDSHATRDFLSDFSSEQLNRMSAEENRIAIPRFNPQELQQSIQPSQLRSNVLSYQNAGASTTPLLSAGGRIPWEMSSMDGQNGGNVLISLKRSEQGGNAESWGADQGTTSSPRSRPKNSLRAEKNILVNWQSSTEPYLNQSPRPQHNFVESGNQGSSSENPEHIPQVSKIHKPHQPETIMPIGNHPSQIDSIANYGRLKFNKDLFKGKGPHESDKICMVKLLNSTPKPSRGNFLLTYDELLWVCRITRRAPPIISALSSNKIRIFMENIDEWYKYWNIHAKIDLEILQRGKEVLRYQFIFPLFLLYVEMIISIIPFKPELPLDMELDYPHEMRNAIQSYFEFNNLINTQPGNGECKIQIKKQMSFKETLRHSRRKPSPILWIFIQFWMEKYYTAVWNKVKESNSLNACNYFKVFFNSLFTHGIETLNEQIRNYLPHK
ncbi:uncharacterized protein VP01_3681g3 [Puccinia sorghi]|uniref:Uncharacterized protein n=1 Tax=Puccinia sorghi TaxID=27349 RepID=A0A0L6UUB3_9BASI|nr:uncharacterized protein VP01_3681g3 [Puccinia sorghi]